MRELVSELDQLVLLIGEKLVIEIPDVQEMGGGSFAFERWTLSNAIGSGDTELALEAARKLYLLKVEPTQIIGDLFRVFRQLWMLRWYIDKNQLSRARKSIRVPTDVFNKLSANARRVSRLRLEDGILLLLEADLNIKRGIRAGDLEISVLIGSLVKLIHRE